MSATSGAYSRLMAFTSLPERNNHLSSSLHRRLLRIDAVLQPPDARESQQQNQHHKPQ